MKKRDASILIADDQPVSQHLFERQLEVLECRRPDHARDGLTAVMWAAARKYDLILMSDRLSVVDGITASELIRKFERENNSKPTVIVGVSKHFDSTNCLKAGMNDFLREPVLLSQLDEILMKWLPLDSEQLTLQRDTTKLLEAESDKLLASGEKISELFRRIAKLRAQGI